MVAALALITRTRGSSGELPGQVARKSGIKFKQKQLCVRPHPLRQLARMHPFARAVLGDHPRPLKIDFARYSLDQRLRAGHDRGNLQRPFQETLEKKNAHRESE